MPFGRVATRWLTKTGDYTHNPTTGDMAIFRQSLGRPKRAAPAWHNYIHGQVLKRSREPPKGSSRFGDFVDAYVNK